MRAGGVRRRAVLLTLALVSLALGPVLYAAATPGGRDAAAPPSLTGTLTKVDLRHHDIAVKVAKGAAKYRGRTVTLIVTSSPPGATSVTRLGHKAKLASIKKGDRVVVTYRLDAHKQLVAIHVIDSGPAPAHGPASSPTTTLSPTAISTSPTPTASSSAPPPTSSIPPGAVTIHMSNYVFTPSTLSVPAGTTVYAVIDSGSHSWTEGTYPTPTAGGFDSNFASVYSFTFPVDTPPGTYPFFCRFHGGAPNHMTGMITITAPSASPTP